LDNSGQEVKHKRESDQYPNYTLHDNPITLAPAVDFTYRSISGVEKSQITSHGLPKIMRGNNIHQPIQYNAKESREPSWTRISEDRN
jgi:hypothetical protein